MLKSVCSDQENQISLAVDNQGKLWKKKVHWEPINFNQLYSNYYSPSYFSEVIHCGRGFIAAGINQEGENVVYRSLLGDVWTPVNLEAQSLTGIAIKAKGVINKMLWDDSNHQLYLLHASGEITVLPDCPKCVKVQKIANVSLEDAEIQGDILNIKLADGRRYSVSKYEASQFRASMAYAKSLDNKKCYFIELDRCCEVVPELEEFLDETLYVPINSIPQHLKDINQEAYIFFYCFHGFKADVAAKFARSNGWKHAYSLGAFTNILKMNKNKI